VNKKMWPEAGLFFKLAQSFIENAEMAPNEVPPKDDPVWEKIKAWATHHEFGPFFYTVLKRSLASIPPDLESCLKSSFYMTAIKAQNSWEVFLSIAKAFQARGICLAPIKGVALLAGVYKDRPCRSMADIDILVKEEEFAEARKLLLGLGYEEDLGGLREAYWLQQHCEMTFTKKTQTGKQSLDVHFRLDVKRPQAAPLPHLWERTKETATKGSVIRELSPEDQLFCLALHQRRFGGRAFCLKNVFDVAMILKAFGDIFDWDYVVREAGAGKMRATTFFILSQARSFFNAEVPEKVWAGLVTPHYKKRMAERLINNHGPFPCGAEKSKELFFRMQFVFFDGFWEPVLNLSRIPIEQFAKYYGLDPYTKRTEHLYHCRLLYGLYRLVFENERLLRHAKGRA